MNFQEAVRVCFSKYVDFNGRASRPEMWFFLLGTFGVFLVASILDQISTGDSIGPVYILSALALFLPTTAAQVRRLHDVNRSGWWVLIGIVPLVGAILLIIWWSQKGTEGPNSYGPEPLAGSPHIGGGAGSAKRSPQSGDLERLERLHALHSSGALTAEEFAAEKAKLFQG